jgi:hypothetical protein
MAICCVVRPAHHLAGVPKVAPYSSQRPPAASPSRRRDKKLLLIRRNVTPRRLRAEALRRASVVAAYAKLLSNHLFEFFFGQNSNAQLLGRVEFGTRILTRYDKIHFL